MSRGAAQAGWDSFLDPGKVCVVGASSDPRRIGGRLVRYSLESGFAGTVIPVNPKHSSVFGVPAVPSLSDVVGGPPDWVVVALSRERVLPVVREAASIGTRNVAIVSAGFAEQDDEGRCLQVAVRQCALDHGMRLLGPNSNGFMNPASGAFFAFTPVIDSARPVAGDVAVITQSAAIGTYLVNWFRTLGLGIRHWVHTGNEADVTVLDVARGVAGRPGVRAVALCIETVRDLEMLRETLDVLAEADLPVGLLHSGTSETGKRASAAHTAALIGDETSMITGLAVDAGAFPASSVRELANFLQLAVNRPHVSRRPRVGFVTTSGGVGVLMADALDTQDLPMPRLSDRLRSQIETYAPFAHTDNPVDTTAQVINQPGSFEQILVDCATSGELDIVAVFIAHGQAGEQDPTLKQVVSVATRIDPSARSSLAAVGVFSEGAAAALQRQGVCGFAEPVDLAHALRAYGDADHSRRNFVERGRSDALRTPRQSAIAHHLRQLPPSGFVDEVDVKDLLASFGVLVPQGAVVADPDEAVAAAALIGGPVAMKVVSPAMPHKAAVGGLLLDLRDPAAVADGFRHLDQIGRRVVGDTGYRILVERQTTGPEVFLSATRHPGLGLVVAMGPGGTGVEDRRDVGWSWPPVGPEQAARALAPSLPGEGAVTAAAPLVTELVAVLVDLMLAAPRIRTIELNPVMIASDGPVVVDALAEVDPLDESGPVGEGRAP